MKSAPRPAARRLLRTLSDVQELCGLHDTVVMIIIPMQFVSMHCGCRILSTDRSSSSLATLLQR